MAIKTLNELKEILSKKNILMDVSVKDKMDREPIIRFMGTHGFWYYHFSYGKNTRGEEYYFYDDWIYTEEQFVTIIGREIFPFLNLD